MSYEPPITDYDHIVEDCTCAFCGCNCDDLDYLVKDNKVVCGWLKGLALPPDFKDMDVLKAIELLDEATKEKLTYCSVCGALIDYPAGYHMAGAYCSGCWYMHKKTKGRICRICGEPEWRCSC